MKGAAGSGFLSSEIGFATERVGLVLPTSLCSSQISSPRGGSPEQQGHWPGPRDSRFVALGTTEACGSRATRFSACWAVPIAGISRTPTCSGAAARTRLRKITK